MARYGDLDTLAVKWMMASPEQRETFRQIIDEHPTADVVPKSEVDDLKRYIILNEDIAIKCKRENGEQNEEYWKGKISAFKQIRAYIDAELKKKYTAQNTNNFDSRQTIEEKKHTKTQSILGEWKFDEKLHTEQPDLSDVKSIDKDGNITNRDDGLDWNEAPPLEESEGE